MVDSSQLIILKILDNTDVHDEIVPKNLTTAHGGFYVNKGPLEFKARESADEDSDSEPEPVKSVNPPPKVSKKKQKVPKESQNGKKTPKMPVRASADEDSDIELLVEGKIPAKKPMPLKKVFNKGFPCSYCPKKFSHKNNLRVHMKEKHKEQLLQWYKTNSDSSPNSKKMSGDQKPSEKNTKVQLLDKKTNEMSKGFPCSYCTKKFSMKNNLRVHMKEKHKEQLLQWAKSGSPNPKKMSNDQTPSEANAKVNESSKGVHAPFPCTYCNGKFTQKNDLRDHMKQKHKEQLLQWYTTNSGGSPNSKKMPNDQTPSVETKKVNELSKDSKKVTSIMEKSDVVEYQLPYGWKKVGSRRSDNQTWDFYVYGPNGQKFRSNVEIKKYLDMNPDVQCDLDVTNTFRIKNTPNDQSRDLLKTN